METFLKIAALFCFTFCQVVLVLVCLSSGIADMVIYFGVFQYYVLRECIMSLITIKTIIYLNIFTGTDKLRLRIPQNLRNIQYHDSHS